MAGGSDPLDAVAGPHGSPPGMDQTQAPIPRVPTDVGYDAQALNLRLGQVYSAAQQESDAKMMEVTTCM